MCVHTHTHIAIYMCAYGVFGVVVYVYVLGMQVHKLMCMWRTEEEIWDPTSSLSTLFLGGRVSH